LPIRLLASHLERASVTSAAACPLSGALVRGEPVARLGERLLIDLRLVHVVT
jgi:hypothetical protein